MFLFLGFILYVWPVLRALRVFTHPELCVTFTRHPMYVNRGFYITPTVIHLPVDGCSNEYVRQMKRLIENLGDSAPFIPGSKHVPNARPKRFAVTAIVAGLAALLSTVSMGNGISNSVDLSKLKETVQFLEKNQARISVDLAESTQELMRMKTEHNNVY